LNRICQSEEAKRSPGNLADGIQDLCVAGWCEEEVPKNNFQENIKFNTTNFKLLKAGTWRLEVPWKFVCGT
jgi:hypothetical protein